MAPRFNGAVYALFDFVSVLVNFLGPFLYGLEINRGVVMAVNSHSVIKNLWN
jgi:hypothetical protein